MKPQFTSRMGRMDPRNNRFQNPYEAINPQNVKRQASAELNKMRQAGLFNSDGTFAQKNLGPTARAYLSTLQESAKTGQLPELGFYERLRREQKRRNMYSGGTTGGTTGGGFFSQTARPNMTSMQQYSKARSGQVGLGRALGI